MVNSSAFRGTAQGGFLTRTPPPPPHTHSHIHTLSPHKHTHTHTHTHTLSLSLTLSHSLSRHTHSLPKPLFFQHQPSQCELATSLIRHVTSQAAMMRMALEITSCWRCDVTPLLSTAEHAADSDE